MWRFSMGLFFFFLFFFALDYLLCRMSRSVVRSSCHAEMGNHYISFIDIFSCGQVFSEQSWRKKKVSIKALLEL